MRDLIGSMLFVAGAKIMSRDMLRLTVKKIGALDNAVSINHVTINANVEEFERGMRRAKGGAL